MGARTANQCGRVSSRERQKLKKKAKTNKELSAEKQECNIGAQRKIEKHSDGGKKAKRKKKKSHMDPTWLTEEEIEYELALRGAPDLKSLPRRARAVRLRAIIKDDEQNGRVHGSATHFVDPAIDLEVCQHNLGKLYTSIEEACRTGDKTVLVEARSRLLHYRDRLAAIEPPDDLKQSQAAMSLQVQDALEDIDDAAGKGRRRGSVTSASGITGEGHRRINDNAAGDTGPPASSPSSSHCVSHPLPATVLERVNDSALFGTFEAPPGYRPPHAAEEKGENGNELLEQLRRMVRNREAAEHSRAPKAIHNWPYRYKGEKNASVLNTFLERVEVFARSEDVDDSMLLKNIKHLLSDEALTWYTSAYLSGNLGSWAKFMTLIRQEFLPASHAFALRVEAYQRMQRDNEPFSSFYQEISTLFRNAQPLMSETEKLFILKKNMSVTYAPIVAAQPTADIVKVVQACKEYDELRQLHRCAARPRRALPC